ncbi:MAG: aromatic ring-hydroxylating dioxygenase subunit alpha [Hyphomicrobiaceae bacterium]
MSPLDNALDRVLEPVSTARGLPNAQYVDGGAFEQEKQAVFFRNWAGIGFGKDVPEPGDAWPVNFLGQPLLVLRDKQGQVRVYMNVCRHRGMILVNVPCRIEGVIRCPYHSWAYGTDGRLAATPHVGGPDCNVHDEIKRDELGLIEVRAHVWQDVIFVNISGEAPRFEDYAADLIARWHEFAKPLYHGGAESSFKLDVACNWKLAVENYCESYHLPWVHPGLNSYSRLEDHYNINEYGRFSGQGSLVYNPKLDDTGRAFTNFDGLSEHWNSGAEYIALYPNLLFGVHRDHVYAILLEAVDQTTTREHVEIYYAKPDMTGDEMADLREKNAVLWEGIFAEDIFVVEGMQKGRHANGFDGGKFSPVMDGPTHCFHHWIASQYTG